MSENMSNENVKKNVMSEKMVRTEKMSVMKVSLRGEGLLKK